MNIKSLLQDSTNGHVKDNVGLYKEGVYGKHDYNTILNSDDDVYVGSDYVEESPEDIKAVRARKRALEEGRSSGAYGRNDYSNDPKAYNDPTVNPLAHNYIDVDSTVDAFEDSSSRVKDSEVTCEALDHAFIQKSESALEDFCAANNLRLTEFSDEYIVVEDDCNFFVYFDSMIGFGQYAKGSYTMYEAIEAQEAL